METSYLFRSIPGHFVLDVIVALVIAQKVNLTGFSPSAIKENMLHPSYLSNMKLGR